MKYLILVLFIYSISQSSFASKNIKAYFNYSQHSSYTDPYRGIHRKGDDLEAVILDQINSAKKTIFLAVQEIRLPLLAKALVAKKKSGLDVRIVLENSYNHTTKIKPIVGEDVELSDHEENRASDLKAFVDMNKDGIISRYEMRQRDAVYILRRGGVRIIDDTADQSRGSGLMHHKFMIVDGDKILVSSANFTLSGIHGDYRVANSLGNANSIITIKSRTLAKSFEREFLYMWGGPTGRGLNRFGIAKPFRGSEKTTILGSAVSVQFSPASRSQPWTETVNGQIGKEILKSKKSMHGALFVFSDQTISDTLEHKFIENKNYTLGLVTERKFAYRAYSELLDIWGLSLKNENCQIEYGNKPWRVPVYNIGVPVMTPGDMLHHKFAVLDEETVIMGSQNWSNSANFQNDENVLIIKNKEVAKLYLEEFERLERNSIKGPPTSLIQKIDAENRRCLSSGFLATQEEILEQ